MFQKSPPRNTDSLEWLMPTLLESFDFFRQCIEQFSFINRADFTTPLINKSLACSCANGNVGIGSFAVY